MINDLMEDAMNFPTNQGACDFCGKKAQVYFQERCDFVCAECLTAYLNEDPDAVVDMTFLDKELEKSFNFPGPVMADE